MGEHNPVPPTLSVRGRDTKGLKADLETLQSPKVSHKHRKGRQSASSPKPPPPMASVLVVMVVSQMTGRGSMPSRPVYRWQDTQG